MYSTNSFIKTQREQEYPICIHLVYLERFSTIALKGFMNIHHIDIYSDT